MERMQKSRLAMYKNKYFKIMKTDISKFKHACEKILELGLELDPPIILPKHIQLVGRGKRVKKAKPIAKNDTNGLTKAVVTLLGLKGFNVWRNNNTAVYDPTRKRFRRMSTRAGVSDIIGHHKKTGRAIYVEIKTGSDKLSDEQRAFLIEALQNGCIAFECREIDDVTRRLKQYDPNGNH
jgi:hypothetical protein